LVIFLPVGFVYRRMREFGRERRQNFFGVARAGVDSEHVQVVDSDCPVIAVLSSSE
jgi:hypothetical protein